MFTEYLEKIRHIANAQLETAEGYRSACLFQLIDQIDAVAHGNATGSMDEPEFHRRITAICILVAESKLHEQPDRKSED
jgi:hypothetical protein